MGRQRILVVDDQVANLKLLDRMLRISGYEDIALVDDSREVLEVDRNVGMNGLTRHLL